MGQPLANTVDEATIRATLAAMETTMANTNAAIQSVEAVSSSVPWTGIASNQYRAALQGWLGGARRVREGLEMLRESMTTHLNLSSNAEDDATSRSQWYSGG